MHVFKIVNGISSSHSPSVSFCQVVLRINSIFEARVGKKHLRRIYHYAETSSGRGDGGKMRDQRCHRVSNRNLLLHIFRFQSQTRTATPRAKLKRDQKVSQRTPPPFPPLVSCFFPAVIPTKLYLLSAHRQRLVSVQSILSKPGRAQASRSSASLEPDLHQRQLFEYFLVVSLQKPKAGSHYLPAVTQQFPLKVKSTTPQALKPTFQLD